MTSPYRAKFQRLSNIPQEIDIVGTIVLGVSGAIVSVVPTLSAALQAQLGVGTSSLYSVVKAGVGLYTVTMTEQYLKPAGLDVALETNSVSTYNSQAVQFSQYSQLSPTSPYSFQIQVFAVSSAAAGSPPTGLPAEAATGSVITFEAQFINSVSPRL